MGAGAEGQGRLGGRLLSLAPRKRTSPPNGATRPLLQGAPTSCQDFRLEREEGPRPGFRAGQRVWGAQPPNGTPLPNAWASGRPDLRAVIGV